MVTHDCKSDLPLKTLDYTSQEVVARLLCTELLIKCHELSGVEVEAVKNRKEKKSDICYHKCSI